MSDSIDHAKLLPVDVNLSFHERLLDSLHDGVYFVDRERKILYWNKGAERLTDTPPPRWWAARASTTF